VSPIDVNPGVDGVLDALERLDGDQSADSSDAPPRSRDAAQEEPRP